MIIFTKKNKDGKFGIRQFGAEFLIDETEAKDIISKGLAFLKVNKPVTKLSQVM